MVPATVRPPLLRMIGPVKVFDLAVAPGSRRRAVLDEAVAAAVVAQSAAEGHRAIDVQLRVPVSVPAPESVSGPLIIASPRVMSPSK